MSQFHHRPVQQAQSHSTLGRCTLSPYFPLSSLCTLRSPMGLKTSREQRRGQPKLTGLFWEGWLKVGKWRLNFKWRMVECLLTTQRPWVQDPAPKKDTQLMVLYETGKGPFVQWSPVASKWDLMYNLCWVTGKYFNFNEHKYFVMNTKISELTGIYCLFYGKSYWILWRISLVQVWFLTKHIVCAQKYFQFILYKILSTKGCGFFPMLTTPQLNNPYIYKTGGNLNGEWLRSHLCLAL
jgi:hypothetical protein